MSTIEQELADWAKSRYPWQQYALSRIAAGKPFSPSDVVLLADEIIAMKHGVAPNPPLRASDISGVSDSEATVALKNIRAVTNVNALLDSQELSFANAGLTVVFGDNGSGKSGYARIIKTVAGARHQEPIHVNVFTTTASAPQKADVTFAIDGEERQSSWPEAVADELKAISFYDESCGDTYMSHDSELTYRPSALLIIDGLIALCDQVRAEIEQRLQQNGSTRGSLPSVPAGTSAAAFLLKLNGFVTTTELDAACSLPNDFEEEYSKLITEEARLRATDPTKERKRLESLASKVGAISQHVDEINKAMSDERVGKVMRTRQSAIELRAAASLASSDEFDREPLPGVGSVTWRALWDAARRYSEQEAYANQSFPVVSDGAHCALCQQVLETEAADRMGRFHAFMIDTTARSADEAEKALEGIKKAIHLLEPTPASISSSLVSLEGEHPQIASKTIDWLQAAADRKVAVLTHLEDGQEIQATDIQHSPHVELDGIASELRDKAKAVEIEGFDAELEAVVNRKSDIEGRRAIKDARDAVKKEVSRLAEWEKLSAAKKLTDTTHITRKSSELADEHVTTVVRDRFVRESDRLRLERIELKKTGGQKGKLRHRPSLLGVKTVQPVGEILSEGEQTALGLAGYFTEAFFDASKSALVLDDPVTSLDHIRRAYVAQSLATFASDRQVIIFTHDLSFLRDLMTAAESAQVTLTERTVQRVGQVPGQISEGYPWKAKDVGRRFDELTRLLASLKKERTNLIQEDYEKECADWAGKLSETWERVISLEIINPVVDPVTDYIRPQSFRVLARVTEADDLEFQRSYGRCSTWLRRHDKSQTVNYVAPEPHELEAELKLVKTWFERVKKYKN